MEEVKHFFQKQLKTKFMSHEERNKINIRYKEKRYMQTLL